MADLVVVVPSRGRPDSIRELAEQLAATSTADTRLLVAVDHDDPCVGTYVDQADGSGYAVRVCDGGSMVASLNQAAVELATGGDAPFALGFMGDDHRPRTLGWDQSYLTALHELRTGLVYGNDLLQGKRLPTQVAMTTDIVRKLGRMSPACLVHLFVDNYWLELGTRLGRIQYLPDVVIEHLHPVAGKAEWDSGYKRVNAPDRHRADRNAWFAFRGKELDADVSAVRDLIGEVGA